MSRDVKWRQRGVTSGGVKGCQRITSRGVKGVKGCQGASTGRQRASRGVKVASGGVNSAERVHEQSAKVGASLPAGRGRPAAQPQQKASCGRLGPNSVERRAVAVSQAKQHGAPTLQQLLAPLMQHHRLDGKLRRPGIGAPRGALCCPLSAADIAGCARRRCMRP